MNSDEFEVLHLNMHNAETGEIFTAELAAGKYEKRGDEIALWQGPEWREGSAVYVSIKFEHGGETYFLRGDETRVDAVS
jgi:hypothetical protein